MITERPNDLGMNSYLEELKKYNVAMVVRVCEATYDVEKLVKEGIAVKDLGFPDGQPPPQAVSCFMILRVLFPWKLTFFVTLFMEAS